MSDWRSLAYRSAHGLHGLLAGEVLRKAEVNHLDATGVVFASEHKVLGLDVAMADVLSVQVDQRGQQLVHNEGRFSLAQVLPFDDEVEQLSSFAISVEVKKLAMQRMIAWEP